MGLMARESAFKAAIQKVPINLCGVMLGCFALGNLVQSFGEGWRMACGAAAVFLLALIVLKIACFPKALIQDLNQPVTAGIAGTFTMGLMFFAVYLAQYTGLLAFGRGLWLCAVTLHFALILWFTGRFVLHFKLKQIYAVIYIVYVGIAVAGVTAPVFGYAATVGTFSFWFGLIAFVLLFFVVTCRYVKYPPETPFKPLGVIYAAPLSLCTVAYVQSVMPKNLTVLLVLMAVSAVFYAAALIYAVGCLRLPFYPSFAAMTFPLVISANALKQGVACAAALGVSLGALKPFIMIETIAAVFFVVYVYSRYMGHIFLLP